MPGAPRFPHIENAEHHGEGSTVFHHLRPGTLGHPERLQRAQVGDQVDPPFISLDLLHGLFLPHRVVKDDPLQPGKPGGIPVRQIGFQDHAV